jgi:hypothetical protein
MLGRPVLLVTLIVAVVAAAPVSADMPRLSPDELHRRADVIMIGKVECYRTEPRVREGEERTQVFLDVLVESVEKGKPDVVGQVIQIRCDRLTRRSPFLLPTHIGNQPIPAPGSRARFFLQGQSALPPNGIELLEGATELDLPMKSPWLALLEWPLVLLAAVALALVVLIAAALYRRRVKRRAAQINA